MSSCTYFQSNKKHNIENMMNEKEVFNEKLKALQFLNDYHHQLHIMIGEEEGSFISSYNEFDDALSSFKNKELVPIKNSFKKIKNNKSVSDPVIKLDYLIDYYQSGLSLQVEAILRGYGRLKPFPLDSAIFIYNNLVK